MPEELSYNDCLEQGMLIRTEPDERRSSQMLNMAGLRQRFWDKEVACEFTALKVEAYYDVIKELIFAHIYKKGYNCKNHLCLIAYLRKNIQDFEFEIDKIDELRKVRNEINYRGFSIGKDYLERNELEFRNIIRRLRQEAGE